MTESEFISKAAKAGHRASDQLSKTLAGFDETLFMLQSAIHISYLAEEIFDSEEVDK